MPTADIAREQWSSIASQVGVLKSDRVVAVLEQQILSGALPTGTVLPKETDLCESLGVSRTVLRDAVRALVARGLLSVRQGRGTVVTEPSDDAFAGAMVALLARSNLSTREVMESREMLETLIVGIAAETGTEDDWARLQKAYDALSDAVAQGDTDAASQAHADFHIGILEATHRPALALMLSPMNKIAVLTGLASVRTGSMSGDWELEAHLPILEALRNKDPEGARKAMRDHFIASTRPADYQEFLDQSFAATHFSQNPSVVA
ncbi:FadR/GntR family transcriptional regulator [Paenarthrobacter sp. NPDC089714]|uniref:FadR/GntR family transcriptional regulator n=1 Tax=Paenarthrobacter sp. NPDC089714 TaxID=3364377 RepID=UPI0037FF494A